jgi:DNA repair exonuclease SbcCD ATPase subunit
MGKIETGVDRLVELVKERKKISIDDATKELGVSKPVVQEWAEFLEEENLIGIEYSLSKTYLVEKKLSKGEVKKKAKEYGQKKEAFVRKVDTALKQLEKETAGFEDIKRAYNSLKDDIGDEIDQVKQELDELKHYEVLKQSIDQDIIQQKIDYQKMVDDVHRKLYAEEKRYEKILAEIKEEESKIDHEREMMSTLEQKEDSLKKRLTALKEVIDGINHEIGDANKSIHDEEDRLARLHQIARAIEDEIKKKKVEELDPLVKASKEHGDKIIKVQDSIISKVSARKDAITTYQKEGQDVIKKFDAFFKKRMETEKLLNDLERNKAEMSHELEGLKQKALAFDLLKEKSDIKKHVKEMEKQYDSFDKKKGTFHQELDRLRKFMGGE